MNDAELVSLRELGSWRGGSTPSKANPAYWTGGSIPWISPKDMKVKEITSSEDRISQTALESGRLALIPEGSVLVVTRSGILAHTLPVAVTKIPVTVNQDLKALTPKLGISPKYVAHALRAFGRRILSDCSKQGTTVSSVDTTALLNFRIPLAEIDEQERIVGEIEKQFSRLDEAVANLKRVKANLRRYKASVLKAAVEGRLVPTEAELARREARSYETGVQLLHRILEARQNDWQGNGKYREPSRLGAFPLPQLPKSWTWSSLDALLREPLRNGHSAKATDDRAGLRAFTLSAVTEGDFSESNTKRTVATAEKVADLWAQPGDIYVERSNTPELVGTARLYRGPPGFAFIPDLLIRVRVRDLVVPAYIEIALQADSGRRYFKARAQGISSSMPKIDQAVVESFPVPLPPLSEQGRIVAEVNRRLSLVHEVDTQIDASRRREGRLREAILNKFFTGLRRDDDQRIHSVHELREK